MKFIFARQSLFSFLSFFLSSFTYCQTIGTFNSIPPTAQTQSLALPATHTFQRIIRTGDALSGGGNLGRNLDFTGYVPIAGSSTNGYLSISSEDLPAECAILSISLNNSTKTWAVNNANKVSFPVPDIGQVGAFCAGTVTPKNTVMVCEEFTPNLDDNGDGYQDLGWIIEIDPATHAVINQDAAGGVDKLWALGREMHEDIAIKGDQSVAYWSADNSTTGFVYKFVPTVAGNFSAGNLYVLQTNSALGTGTWQPVNNTTKGDRNTTPALATAAGGYNFNRVEGLEIGPDGKIYFAATTSGRIYRFTDNGTTVSQLEVFVESSNYDVDGSGPIAPEPWSTGADNIAFDGEGNLWVLQDGGQFFIWVVSPSHTAANPSIRLFATLPAGSEPTGITFSPDYNYLFLSVQHPNTTNTATQTDAAGASVVFNTHTTIVIARKEFLGVPDVILPLRFTNFDLKKVAASVEINWSVTDAHDHDYFSIERSIDGVNFTSIGKNKEAVNNSGKKDLRFIDTYLPNATSVFYRIKQCAINGSCGYSVVKEIRLDQMKSRLELYPVPVAKVLNIDYRADAVSIIHLSVLNEAGIISFSESKRVSTGKNSLAINTAALAAGKYILMINDGKKQVTQPFTKL